MKININLYNSSCVRYTKKKEHDSRGTVAELFVILSFHQYPIVSCDRFAIVSQQVEKLAIVICILSLDKTGISTERMVSDKEGLK